MKRAGNALPAAAQHPVAAMKRAGRGGLATSARTLPAGGIDGPLGRRLLVAALLATLSLAAAAAQVFAGGAFIINGDGEPLLWDTSAPIVFNIDQGSLGQLGPAEAQALALAAFGVWGSETLSSVQFIAGDMLPCDVTPATVNSAVFPPEPGRGCGPDSLPIIFEGDDGYSPVIFDEDGGLMDLIFGIGASNDVLGVAFIDSGFYTPPEVVEAEIILNGRWYDGIDSSDPYNPESPSLAAFQSVFVHENGHWLNLDHAQANYPLYLDGNGANDALLPTMFPASGDDDSQLGSLNPDDIATLVALYPATGAEAVAARITGQVLIPVPGGGSEPISGANVLLRAVNDPFFEVYSSLTGGYYVPDVPAGSTREEFGGPAPESLRGSFSFLVPPGEYTLEVEEVDPIFVDGSGIGPLPAPVMVPGRHEYWNVGESFDPVADPPGRMSSIIVGEGEVRTGVDIMMNIPPLPAVLYAVDDEKFSGITGPTAIIELDLATGTILRRIPAPEINSAFQEGLAWAASRGTLFFTDGGNTSQDIYELDPTDGTVLNTFPWPAGAIRIDGLAFLNGPNQPAGGVLYALDSGRDPNPDIIFGLDPDNGNPKGTDIIAGNNLFGALGGYGDDLYTSNFGGGLFHLRPHELGNPLIKSIRKPSLKQFDPAGIASPGLDQFITGLGYDGETLYAASINAPDFRVWRIEPDPVTEIFFAGGRLDVVSSTPDPTPVVLGGFSAVDVAMRGDIDGNMRVDGYDLAALARVFPSSLGSPEFRAAADLDRDDDVDENDLTVLAAFFGRGVGAD